MSKTVSFFSWNVRGLGKSSLSDDVLSELISTRPSIAALQETKLPALNSQKRRTFLPARLSSYVARGSSGASGGILTAWDAAVCSLSSTVDLPYTLTTGFSLLADNMPFMLSNVYAPTLREDKAAFLSELASGAEMVSGA